MKAGDLYGLGWRMGIATAGLALGAVLGSGAAFAQISGTKHNLSSSGSSSHVTGSGAGQDEICVFCHTPHGASSGAGGPPLWNKTLSTTGYTTYSTTTLDSTAALTGAPSLACLSCHDGSQAMDSMINAPGAGLYNSAGARPLGGTGYTWTGGPGTDGKMTAASSTYVINLGQDLTNDHPVAINYCGGTGNTGTGALTCGDDDFQLTTGTNNKVKFDSAKTVWWVETGGNSTRNKTDLPLYTRTVSAATGPYVECGTCHDPHVDGTGSSGATFLRIPNSASQICLACHVK